MKRLNDQNQQLLSKQTTVIHDLQKSNKKYWEDKQNSSGLASPKSNVQGNISNSGFTLSQDDTFDHDIHFGELNDLKAQFSSLGKELEELHNQMKAKIESEFQNPN